MNPTNINHFDAIVVGAGITGLYQVYALREMGFTVKGFDAAEGFGGTWHWNRYPGCRLDTESYTYAYLFMKDILPEWSFKERFAGQPELLEYIRYAADTLDLEKDFAFNHTVKGAVYDKAMNTWHVQFDNGNSATCTYLITAIGFLSATRMPNIAGIESFKGESFHSSRWPRDPAGGPGAKQIDFSGKRVGVIGTGATGVQIISEVAHEAGELFVFQRSPNWCTPLGNSPLTPEEMAQIREARHDILDYVKTTPVGFPHHPVDKGGVDTTAEERQEFYESLYKKPGYAVWLGNYNDIFFNKQSNAYLGEFVASKIRGRVKDPAIAEKLIPKDHPFGTKRVPMETKYYEVYNQDNVHLVDVKEHPIEEITARGVKTSDAEYELDILIYATGFDAIVGAFDRIDIRGIDGVALKDVWEDGPLTYLGLQTKGFPNLFTLVGAHNGASFCNIGVCGGLQVEWVSKMLDHMRRKGLSYAEPMEAAQAKWTKLVYDVYAQTLLTEADSWWTKIKRHPDGTETRRALAWVGGGPQYRELCDEVEQKEYEGFELR